MNMLLFLRDQKTSWSIRVKKILPLLKQVPAEIILQFPYQIPNDSDDVIASLDRIKTEVGVYVHDQAQQIYDNTGILTSTQIVLGSAKSTLKRILQSNDISYVIADHEDIVDLDHTFRTIFPNISFIFTTSRLFDYIPTLECSERYWEALNARFNTSNFRAKHNGHADVKILRQKTSTNSENVDTLISI